jgi:hypothetical protein
MQAGSPPSRMGTDGRAVPSCSSGEVLDQAVREAVDGPAEAPSGFAG